MKLAIGAIGLLKTGPEKELARAYEERIRAMGKKAGITALEMRDWGESQLPAAPQRAAEEASLLWSLGREGITVLLDERGKAMTSEAFAAWLGKQAAGGARQVTFLLGGPDGHAAESREQADLLLSFGPMTFPHRLARVMLLEQLYRAVTILLDHPYHRP